MKKVIVITATVIMAMTSYSSRLNAQTVSSDNKILVVYYSWSSNGNTRYMAQQIQKATGADIFEIVPVHAYPDDYKECVEQAKIEINNKHKPDIKGTVENFDAYNIIIVGSPNWCNTIAPPVATFLANYDFKGKTIMPFMTHGSTRLGNAVNDIEALCPNATVTSGLPIRGENVRDESTSSDIAKWLSDNGAN